MDVFLIINYPLGKNNITGRSLVIKRNYNFIRKASKSDKNILIYGETGTGKELAARKIHELSDRKKSFLCS
jgi:transcriptional regulator with PAS, ATPase and Fis domain